MSDSAEILASQQGIDGGLGDAVYDEEFSEFARTINAPRY